MVESRTHSAETCISCEYTKDVEGKHAGLDAAHQEGAAARKKLTVLMRFFGIGRNAVETKEQKH